MKINDENGFKFPETTTTTTEEENRHRASKKTKISSKIKAETDEQNKNIHTT